MVSAEGAAPSSLITIPRMVVSVAAGVVSSVERAVVGETRTARSNAWEAVCADRDRARHRDETRRLVAALAARRDTEALAAQLTVGSSPRSSESQAVLVSVGADTSA